MAEIIRPDKNVKAFASDATGTNRTVFGGTTQSDTLDDNLNTDFEAGWEEGTTTEGFPPIQYFNAATFTSTQLVSYLFQRGVAQWNINQEFYHPTLTFGSDNKLYISVQDNIGEDPTTDATNTYWIEFNQGDELPITTRGDLIVGDINGDPVRLGAGAEGQYPTPDASGDIVWANLPSGEAIAIFEDQKSSGTDGGTLTLGAWQIRELNTTVFNNISGASLSSNTFTLPAGTYYIEATASANAVNANKIRLYNVTGSVEEATGVNNYSNTSSAHSTPSTLKTAVTILSPTVFRIEHRSITTNADDGLGRACSFGTEVYANVSIVKKS